MPEETAYKEARAMPDTPNPPSSIEELAASLNHLVTDQKFLDIINDIARAPHGEQSAKAAELLTTDELVRRGIPVPAGARLSSRLFEDPAMGRASEGEVLAHIAGEAAPEGWSVCGSVGAVCVCGSVGWSQ
jgi:hypothetical protein